MRKTAIYLIAFNCCGAITGGGILMIDSTGESLGMPVKWLQHSPFKDYFIPGLLLFLIIGLGGMLALIFTIYRKYYYQELDFLLGLALSIWMIVQLIMLQTINLLHFLFGITGFVLLILGWKMIKAKKTQASSSTESLKREG